MAKEKEWNENQNRNLGDTVNVKLAELEKQFQEQQYKNIEENITMLSKQNISSQAITIYRYSNKKKTSLENLLIMFLPKYNSIFKKIT